MWTAGSRPMFTEMWNGRPAASARTRNASWRIHSAHDGLVKLMD